MVSRKLDQVLRELEPLAERGKIARFIHNVKDAETLTGLADDIRDAMMDYQVRTTQHLLLGLGLNLPQDRAAARYLL